MTAYNFDLDALIENNAVIVCSGSGGVGKTTTSAVIGIRAAILGKKVLVCTIDPARRLANSLGLGEMTGVEKEVDSSQFVEAGTEMKGSLTALMLDMKRSFDELVERTSPSEERKQKILNNNIYKNVSTALGGSQEYIAMQKLADLHSSGRYDLIVLDTPPTRHALDFLEAPSKIGEFFTARIVDFFFKPGERSGRFGYRVFQKGGNAFLDILKRLTGAQLLEDIADFFENFDALLPEFTRQGKVLEELLASPDISFLIVTSAEELAARESIHFLEHIEERRLPFGGFIVNRVHRTYGVDLDERAAVIQKLVRAKPPAGLPGGKETYAGLVDTFDKFLVLASADRRSIETLAQRAQGRLAAVPFFDKDVYDIPDLLEISRHLREGEPSGL